MAVYRETPKCIICGKVNAEGIYKHKEDFIGDTFITWKDIPHKCDERKKKQFNKYIEIFLTRSG